MTASPRAELSTSAPRAGVRLPNVSVPAVAALAALIALPLAVSAQGMLADQQFPLDGIIVFAVAVLIFCRSAAPLLGADLPLVSIRRSLVAGVPTYPHTGRVIAGSVLLAGVAYVALGGHTFTRLNLALWIGSLLLFVAAFGPAPRAAGAAVRARWGRVLAEGWVVRIRPASLALIAVLLLAAFFHLYRLDQVPVEPTSDHAEKLLDVRDVLEGHYRVFFPRNTGREPLQFYLAVPLASVFGLTHFTLKLETALVGLLAVFGVYLLGSELLGRGYGLIAAALVAVASWEVGTARMGLRFPLATAATAFSLYFFFRALRTGATRDFLFGGLAVGVGLHGYTPFRVVPPLLVLLGVLWLVLDCRDRRAQVAPLLRGFATLFGAAFLAVLPLVRFMADDPSMFWERTASRLAGDAFAPAPQVGVVQVASAVTKALLMFNWRGDVGWTVVVSNIPVLEPTTAALFVLGVGWLVYVFVQRGAFGPAALLVSVPILLASSWASFAFPIENPSANRAAPAIPVVFLVAALPLGMVCHGVQRAVRGSAGTLVAVAVVALTLVPTVQAGFDRYFIAYAGQYDRRSQNVSEIADAARPFVQATGSMGSVYTLLWPHWFDNRNLALELGSPTWSQVIQNKEREIPAHRDRPGPRLYIVHRDDAAGRALLRQTYPGGIEQLHASRLPGREFVTFTVLSGG